MIRNNLSILIVDDEKHFRSFLQDALEPEGHSINEARNGQEGLVKIENNNYDLAFVDIKMPIKDGIALLKEALVIKPNIKVIIMSALNDIEKVIESIKFGAFHFLNKPVDIDLLFKLIDKVQEYKKINTENKILKEKLSSYENTNNPIIGSSPKLLREIEKTIKIAKTNASCIIFGESGTGKELICDLIHKHSNRNKEPIYKINCAAIPNNLLESELFGYEKGSFTGAFQSKQGMFELANNGSLFLDEIGDLDLRLQAKLLRVLESGEFYRIGGLKPIKTNVRTISATNKNLIKAIENKSFREDLYYRLNVININLPPLRERKEDIPILTQHFIRVLSKRNNQTPKKISKDALNFLEHCPLKGNIRELKNIIERAIVLSKEEYIKLEDINEEQIQDNKYIKLKLNIGIAMSDIETIIIQKTLDFFKGDKDKTAENLGISTRKIFYKLKEQKSQAK